jgi:glycosyltransferase involved in cell wall biosynthesis
LFHYCRGARACRRKVFVDTRRARNGRRQRRRNIPFRGKLFALYGFVRIAQVAPLYESVPPKLYGGTERVVSYITEALVREGQDVTLYASGDSETAARLVKVCNTSLRLDNNCKDSLAHHIRLLEYVHRDSGDFDIIHFHIDYMHFPLSRRQQTPSVTTLHGRLDLPDLVPLYREFADIPVVSISNSQRRPLPGANWVATVYHGIPRELYRFHANPAGYLAFIGRISPEKRVDRAIEIALGAGVELKIAAKVDAVDREYFEDRIEPMLKDPLIDFVGEIGEKEKNDFLGNARALLFPIDWPEPFGLAIIEALACGTPVIAWRNGSVPEIVEDGITGFVIESIDEGAKAVGRIAEISRQRCRQVFEKRFTCTRMARDYINLYQNLIGRLHPGISSAA